MFEDELWAPITTDMLPNVVPDRYLISNYGRVKNGLTGVFVDGSSVMSPDGRNVSLSRARLVYMAFVGPIEGSKKIWFIDNNPNNLYYKNLYQVTKADLNQIRYEQNAIKFANASNQHMSSRGYYRSDKKIMCYPIDEEWLDITQEHVPDIKPWYLVSNYGRVYSKANDAIMKQSIINSGYARIQPISIYNVKIDLLVHRLVALVWVPNDNPYIKREVNHKDGNTFNNRADNLEWVTPLENQRFRFPTDDTYYNIPFTTQEVHNICKALEDGMDYMKIALDVLHRSYTGMLHKRIWRIHKRVDHVDISSGYKF